MTTEHSDAEQLLCDKDRHALRGERRRAPEGGEDQRGQERKGAGKSASGNVTSAAAARAEGGHTGFSRLAGSHRRFLETVARELALRDRDGSRLRRISDPDTVTRDAAAYALDTAATWTEHLGGFYGVDAVRKVLSRCGKPVSKPFGRRVRADGEHWDRDGGPAQRPA